MAVTPKLMVTGTMLTDALVLLYTVPANTVAKVQEIIFTNHDTEARNVALNLIDFEDTAADKNELLDATGWVLAAGETRFIGLDQTLETEGFIQAVADVAAKVSVRISGIEIT